MSEIRAGKPKGSSGYTLCAYLNYLEMHRPPWAFAEHVKDMLDHDAEQAEVLVARFRCIDFISAYALMDSRNSYSEFGFAKPPVGTYSGITNLGTTKIGYGTTAIGCRVGSRYVEGGFKNLTEKANNYPKMILICRTENNINDNSNVLFISKVQKVDFP